MLSVGITSMVSKPWNPPDVELTARQIREVRFYEEFALNRRVEDIRLDLDLDREARPWNPAWFVYEFACRMFRSDEQRLLDLGCGVGVTSAYFARIGYETHGVDITPANIAMAGQIAQRFGLESRLRFSTQAAERLRYPDDYFDVVAGIDILHHVEVREAVSEVMRVLRPGGVAIFKEWTESPVLDRIRTLSPILRFFPKGVSLERQITSDERKLGRADLEAIRSLCPNLTILPFRLLARLHRLLPRREGEPSSLEKLDRAVFRTLPFLRRFAGAAVLILRK